MRCAAYLRVSTAEQVESFSLDAQMRAIETWVQDQGGTICGVYVEEGASGRTLDRPVLRRLLRDVLRGQFERLVVHRYDRLSRSAEDALVLQLLLMTDHDVVVSSVSEPFHGNVLSPDGGMQNPALFVAGAAAAYSSAVARDTATGKRERARQGYHNNRPPFGLRKGPGGLLIADEETLPAVQLAFTRYATGAFSDNAIARLLNEAGFRSVMGRRFSKDTVRDMLQNRTYLGEVRYQAYRRSPDGRRRFSAPIEWFPGLHEGVVDPALFEQCRQVRQDKQRRRRTAPREKHYRLQGLVFCRPCAEQPPAGGRFRNYGLMRCQSQADGRHRYYRCSSRQQGSNCRRPGVRANDLHQAVHRALRAMTWPAAVRRRLLAFVEERLADRHIERRLAAVRQLLRNSGTNHLPPDSAEARSRPAPGSRDALMPPRTPVNPQAEAQLVVDDFPGAWQACGGNRLAEAALYQLLLRRVLVTDGALVALQLTTDDCILVGK